MKIAVWRTGHEIADRVCRSLMHSCRETDFTLTGGCLPIEENKDILLRNDAHIGYGILRGMAEVFRNSNCWFEVDRGYFKPSHYDGYYRISCLGTQQCFAWVEPDYERLEQLQLDLKPWRGFDDSKPVLVIPPTEYVEKFFGIDWEFPFFKQHVLRRKGDASPINFSDYNYVLTFNSSVGWKALQAGIPCVSDPTHSMLGSWFKNLPLDELVEKQLQDREKLFATMAALQFTLSEIEQGMVWPLIESQIREPRAA